MIQTLSAFCFYSGSLRALENMRESNRTVLIRALLTPYANRPWAMTNLILVRFWKGCGFGFRYSQVYPSKFLQSLRKDRIQGKKIICNSIVCHHFNRSIAINEISTGYWTLSFEKYGRCTCIFK